MEKNDREAIKNNIRDINILSEDKTISTLMSIKGMFADKILERGDLRFLILDTISENPKNGYQVIMGISKRFLGMYKPSPGVIYPTLQSLEDEGLILAMEKANKKAYDLTKKGEKELRLNGGRIDGISSHIGENIFGTDEKSAKKMEALMKEWVNLAYEIFYRNLTEFRSGSPESYKKMVKVEKILKAAILDAQNI
jgi:DNA-binding PadR family transcriptional regulator